jgi:hypothetical protein
MAVGELGSSRVSLPVELTSGDVERMDEITLASAGLIPLGKDAVEP